ncbi:MAG: hypothetical protein H7838_03640, partial [Magnetococcus sp. DMHC-8]
MALSAHPALVAPPPVGRLLLVFLAMGAFAQLAQALLIREWLVVFQGNEISIGAFYGGWLFWIAVGGWGIVRWAQRRPVTRPLAWVHHLLLALPLLLLLQVGAVRSVRLFLAVPAGHFIPLDTLFASAVLLTLPAGVTLGMLFPLACQGWDNRQGEPVARLYAMESLGALAGALLFTFVLADTPEFRYTLGLLFGLMAGAAWLLQTAATRHTRLWTHLTLLTGLLLALTPAGDWLTTQMEQWRFHTLHPTLQWLDSRHTRYGHVAIGRLGEQYSVVEDGRISASFPDPRRVALDAAFFHTQIHHLPASSRVLLFGGLHDGLAFAWLRYGVDRLDAVIPDQQAFEHLRTRMPEAFRQGLQDPRLHLHFGDGRGHVNQLPDDERFDLVLLLLADPDSVSHNRYYTREFYARLQTHLQPGGVLCTRVSGASNYLGRDIKSYSGSIFHTLGELFPYRIAVPGDDHTFCASAHPTALSVEAPELARRHQARPPATDPPLPDEAFANLLPTDHVRFLRARLEAEAGEPNTDLKPVTFYLNMLLWGKFTASHMGEWFEQLRRMGTWPYWLPLVVAIGLFVLGGLGGERDRPATGSPLRQAALFTLLVLGFVAMAGQLLIVFGFQASIGAIYSRIALLNGLFMSGLALGAYLPGRWWPHPARPVGPLVAILLGMAGAALLFPTLLSTLATLRGETAAIPYYALSILIGMLTGAGFALAAALTRGTDWDSLAVGGLAEAGDHLGGALGGVATGGLLVPILGMTASAQLLAVMILLTIPPLLLAPHLPLGLPFFRVRSHTAFAHPGLTRLVWFILITALAL